MRPLNNPSAWFAADQDWQFRVRLWDTPYTVIENDLGTEGMFFAAYEPKSATTDWPAYVAALKAVGSTASPLDELSDTAYVRPLVEDGRWPVVQAYWGAGTPSWWGGTVPGKVALRYSGVLVPAAQRAWYSNTSEVTFAVAGSGWCRIDIVDGMTRTQVFEADLSEGLYLSEGFLLSAPIVVPAGASIDVLYVQTGTEPWGGLVVKTVPNGGSPETAPVLGAGLFSAGSVTPTTLAFVKEASVQQEPGAASRAELVLPLINPAHHDGHGWEFVRPGGAADPGALQLWDGGDAGAVLKRFRLLRIEVARREATPTWTPIFTGHANDFTVNEEGLATVNCAGFEGRLVEQYEQVPDRISYMSRGFRTLDYGQASDQQMLEPVYNVPAFDNWPLAWAVEEIGIRAGLDPSLFRKTALSVGQDGSGTPITLPWGPAYRFRGETTSGALVRLPRPVHYGNVGYSFTENRPIDDDYMFPIEPTTDGWAAIRKLTDKLGYACRFDTEGAAILYPMNTPSFVVDLRSADVLSGTVTEELSASAYGATYLEATTAQAVVQKNVTGARIDVAFPRIDTALGWTVRVYRVTGNVLQATVVVDPADGALETLEHMFSSRTSTAGTSNTLVTVFSGAYDTYRVELTSENSAGSAYVDAIVVYAQDPALPMLPALATDELARNVSLRGQQDATRNRVTIVGRRKGTVTDSDKFAEAKAPTEQEFVAQSAVDVGSITDPTAANYVGYVKQAVIYDESITDDAFARYLAEVFIYRQRTPQPGAGVSHTLLPMVDIGDPVAVAETTFESMQAAKTQYIRTIQHRIENGTMQTTLETEPWAPYPAYETRTDIDLALFDDQPIVVDEIAYTSLSAHPVVNPTAATVLHPVYESEVYVTHQDVPVATNGLGTFLDLPPDAAWPPVDGTVQIAVRDVGAVDSLETTFTKSATLVHFNGYAVVNIPIMPDWRIESVIGEWEVQVYDPAIPGYDWQPVATYSFAFGVDYFITERLLTIRVDGQPFLPSPGAVYAITCTVTYKLAGADLRNDWIANNPYHQFTVVDHDATSATETAATAARLRLDWQQGTGTGVYARDAAATSYDVRYRSLLPANTLGGRTVGVDPNGLVEGEPFSPFYDPYTSELGYLVRIKADVLAEGLYRISIRNRQTDDVVAWLTNPGAEARDDEQHWEYISTAQTLVFNWDGVDQVGLWNAKQSELYDKLVGGTFGEDEPTRIGSGHYVWNQEIGGATLGPMAYVWMKRDANGRPYIGQGTFAEWYVHVESKTAAAGESVIKSDASVFTHLPEPTKLELRVEDWDLGTSQYVDPALNVNTTTLGAWIRDGDGGANPAKPVRMRFKVASRPGALWEGQDGEVSIKLTREVHLRALIGDQIVVWRGSNFAGLDVEDRTIYNRRLVNDEHTLRYADAGFRKAKFLKWTDADPYGVTEWVFQPSDFQKDFRLSGLRESIRFGDYLQLEEVPEWNGTRDVGTARSRLQFAVMSYLFYLSAFVTDRSGRSCWGLYKHLRNGTTPVVDKAKQLANTAPLNWADDAMYQHKRSIIVRQWTNEPSWEAAQRDAFSYAENSLFDKLLKHWWYQHDIKETNIGVSSPAAWNSFGLTVDAYSNFHTTFAAHDLPAIYGTAHRQLGTVTGVSGGLATITQRLGTGGTWTWENKPAWVPSITRDLHPFYFVPPMWVPPAGGTLQGGSTTQRTQNTYTSVAGPNVAVVNLNGNSTNVEDIAAATTWTSWVRDMTQYPLGADNRFYPGFQVEREYFRSKGITAQPNMLNYVRQDETIHYEELRGTFTRNSYPAGGPVKLNSTGPYYINHHRYYGVDVRDNRRAPGYPMFHIVENPGEATAGLKIDWFRTAFRSHYVWESGSMYPVDNYGRERLPMTMWWRTRFYGTSVATQTLYDFGAWTGWKDDLLGSTALVVKHDGTDCSAFTTDAMVVGVSSVLPETVELTAHLVLVPERRGDL